MKVLMMVSQPEYGGTETHVLALAKVLRSAGVQVGVATFGGPFVPHLRSQQIRVHHIATRAAKTSRHAASAVVAIVKQHQYDIIHAHDSESFAMFPALKAALPRVPLVITVHGRYYSRSELQRAAESAAVIIAVSPSVRQWLVRTVSGCVHKLRWIPNGIDTRKFTPATAPQAAASAKRRLGLPQTAKVCLYAGRFQSDKWHVAQKFIAAAERVARDDTSLVAVLLGFGSRRPALRRAAQAANARLGRSAIRVLPHTAHMEPYYRAATLVVGTGRVALEALACGRPVIAAGRAGYEGTVRPVRIQRAIATHFGDHAAHSPITVARLAQDMRALLAATDVATRWGLHGRSVVCRRFSIRRTGLMTRRAYLAARASEGGGRR